MCVGAGWVMVCMTTWELIFLIKIKTDVDEASDTYDTIDWLVKNTDNNNGMLEFGNFIPRFYATYSLLSRHPALKAVSPQACISDFSLMIFTITEPIYWAIESHAAFGIQRRNTTSAWYQIRVGNQRWLSVLWTQDLCLTWMHFMERDNEFCNS
jgi:predicted acyl esterase